MSVATSVNVNLPPRKRAGGWDVNDSTLSSKSETERTESLRNSGNSGHSNFISSKRIIEPLRQSGRDWNLKHHSLESLRIKGNRLYGREEQVAQLKKTFRDSTSSKQLVILEGPAGVGKSALAHQLKPVAKVMAGFYLEGKFDLQVPVEPYAAWTDVVRELTNSLLAHQLNPHDFCNKWQFSYEDIALALRQELNEDGLAEVLTSVFPDLVPVLGGTYLDQRTDTTDYKEAKNRLNYAFRKLVRVLSDFGPVVLMMDDVHWSDVASLDMLKVLLTDPELKGVMVIACLRPEEITEDNPFSIFRKEILKCPELARPVSLQDQTDGLLDSTESSADHIKQSNDRDYPAPSSLFTTEVMLGSLSPDCLHSLLQDMLTIPSNSSESRSLTDCVFRKTAGNAFFVLQFLQILVVENLLTYNVGSMEWLWDIDRINQSQVSSLNVVQMVQANITRLAPEIQRVLPVVACLGAACEYNIFEKVLNYFLSNMSNRSQLTDNQQKPKAILMECQEVGLLTLGTTNSVSWEHDRLQEAALKLVSKEELSSLRFRLGCFLLDDLEPQALDSSIFLVANLLDGSASILDRDDNTRRIGLAELNLAAGKKAMKATASVGASPFLSRGIELLPEGHWETHYQLSLDLFSTAAEACLTSGDFTAAELYCHQVFAREGRPLLDSRRCHSVMLTSAFAQGNVLAARDRCLDLLSQLGCDFPKKGQTLHTIAGLLKIKASVKQARQRILGLPSVTNPLHVWTMKLLDMLCTYTYSNNPSLFALIILKGYKYTMKYGVSDFSPCILAVIALILGTMGDLQGAKIYSDIALELFDKFDISKMAYGRTLFITSTMALHYQVPADQIQKYLFKGYKEGMAVGDVENAMWSIFNYLEVEFHTGIPLPLVGKDCQEYLVQMKDLKQKAHVNSATALLQVILYLTEPSTPNVLCGPVFDWREQEKDENFQGTYNRVRIKLAFWAGDYQETMTIMEECGALKGSIEKKAPGIFAMYSYTMHGAMTCFHFYRQTKARKYRRMANYYTIKIKSWAKKGCPNCQHSVVLINAEELAIRGKFTKAIKAYKESIRLAGRQGFIHDQALANERLGDYYWSLEFYEEALFHIENATKLYGEWGNQKKVKLMQELYPRKGRPPASITISPGAFNGSNAGWQSTDFLSVASPESTL